MHDETLEYLSKMEPEEPSALKQRILQKDKVKISVIGIGYAGLPLAVKLAHTGFFTIGIDINEDIIQMLSDGRSTVEGISDDQILDVVQKKQSLQLLLVNRDPSVIEPTSLNALVGTDIFIICVQTPLRKDRGREPDTQWIEKSVRLIRRVYQTELKSNKLPKERLVVLESTTYPGTTKNIVWPFLEEFNNFGILTYLAYSPERTNPGPKAHESNGKEPGTFEITRIVGGLNCPSTDMAVTLYCTVFKEVYPVSDLETAEMVKLVENTFRFISINFANEMSKISEILGLNIREINTAARTKGFGLDLCDPGLIGGHCIPIDPHYLAWVARKYGQNLKSIEFAEAAHRETQKAAFGLVERLLNLRDKAIRGSSILFLGVTFKKDIADTRESKALHMMKKLYVFGANVSFWDPVRASHPKNGPLRLLFSNKDCDYLSSNTLNNLREGNDQSKYLEPKELRGDWLEVRNQVLKYGFDCVVLATDHNEFKSAYADLIVSDLPIVDLKNSIPSWLDSSNIPTERQQSLKRILSKKGKYMLLGVGLLR